jgi:hypothetical protein
MDEFNQIPAIVKHMTLAIFRKGGSGPRAFETALKIAVSQLRDHGYLTNAAFKPLNIKLSGKGLARNRVHLREGARKTHQFNLLFQKYQIKLAAGRPARETETDELPDGQRE